MDRQDKRCLVAVVVTHNRLSQLRITLGRLLDSDPAHLHAILVVDNASSDDTATWLVDQADPRLHVYRSEANLGGAGGFETGMRQAVERFDPDWILVMDDDARPEPGALAVFHAGERSKAEAWAAAVYYPDGRICDMNRPSINPFWHGDVMRRTLLGGGRDGFHLSQPHYAAEDLCDVDGASFVGLFVSRAGVARIGYPDGSLFLYGDDVLYTLGLRQAGGRILFDPAIRFEHDFSTISDGDRRFRPLWKSYYHYRNLLMVYRLCSGWLFPLVLPAAAAKWLLKVRFHSGERRVFLGYVLRALRDGVLHRKHAPHAQVLTWGKRGRARLTQLRRLGFRGDSDW
ncbi:glycosyltransferase [Pseudophaeobacter sp.]|uniref:glycosyltransferase n=1 Tax=Pseudophaeobacter sp. TaxID=1971739 RepID=UPI004057EB56